MSDLIFMRSGPDDIRASSPYRAEGKFAMNLGRSVLLIFCQVPFSHAH